MQIEPLPRPYALPITRRRGGATGGIIGTTGDIGSRLPHPGLPNNTLAAHHRGEAGGRPDHGEMTRSTPPAPPLR
ncbi:MAG: hypothetical protein KA314_05800 [Chloroflexi bacterium]|nr:hypothetical protein [Chloroflexota bacterium]